MCRICDEVEPYFWDSHYAVRGGEGPSSEMENRPDEPSLMEMSLTQMRKLSIMTADLNYFDNVPMSHADRCYAWLVAVVQKHVLQHKEKQLVREYTRQAGQPSLTFSSSGRQSHASPAAPFTRADRLRDVGLHLAGVQAQVVERDSLRHGAETIGLTQSLLAEGAKVAHVMTDLTRVHLQLVGPTNLFREEISGKMLTDQIRYAINYKVHGVALMAVHASFNMSDSPKRLLQQQKPVLHMLRIHNPPILLQSDGNV